MRDQRVPPTHPSHRGALFSRRRWPASQLAGYLRGETLGEFNPVFLATRLANFRDKWMNKQSAATMGLFSSTYPLASARSSSRIEEANSRRFPGTVELINERADEIPRGFIIRKLDEIEKYWRIIRRPASKLAS